MSRPSGLRRTWLEYFSVASRYTGCHSYLRYSLTGIVVPWRSMYCCVGFRASVYFSQLSLLTTVPTGGSSPAARGGPSTVTARARIGRMACRDDPIGSKRTRGRAMGEGVECGEYSAGDDLVKALDQMIDLFGCQTAELAVARLARDLGSGSNPPRRYRP